MTPPKCIKINTQNKYIVTAARKTFKTSWRNINI